MTVARSLSISAAFFVFAIGGALAQGGPVGSACGDEIAKLCTDKPHDGSVRICLETNYDKVSAACKSALDSTGGGRGKGLMGLGKGKSR